MKLERLTLDNFRQYYGRQRVEFSRDDYRRVTVVHGANGAGKTSMFLAINWCLYGEGVENVGELISKEAIEQSEPGSLVSAIVEITFSHEAQRFLARRVLSGIKQLDGSVEHYEQQYILMRVRWDGQGEQVSSPLTTMNAILPANVRTYFLFDGEKIDQFAKPEAASEVKDAIYLILRLEVLDRARRHLEDMARDYRRQLKQGAGTELRELIDKTERAREERDKIEKRRIELKEQTESAHRRIADIDQRLREMQSVTQLQQQRERIELDLRQRRSELEDSALIIKSLVTQGYIVAGERAANGALDLLNQKRIKGEIPSSIRQQLVQDLLDSLVCVCGRPFAKGGAEYERLLSLLKNSVPSILEDRVLTTSSLLGNFAIRISEQLSNLNDEMHRQTKLKDYIRALEAELGEIENQLRGSSREDVSRLEVRRQTYRADIEEYMLEDGMLKGRLSELTKQIEELDEEITKAEKNQEKQERLTRKLLLSQQSINAIEKEYQAFADDMRRRIEAEAKRIFKLLIWKSSHFQDIQLGNDYNLEVIDRYGRPARPELSAGERQVLSLSFITAMALVSGEESPLVMDTPFGRLSSQHRNSVTEHLPELASQLILLVTDEELRDQARSNLEPRIGAEYRLEFDPTSSCTQIVEV
jgi:DNA sulfur modification protein DndD